MANYTALVKIVIDQADLQKQINNTTIKPITIPITANLNTKKIETQIKLWENSLEKMRARAPDAFNDARVQKEVTAFKNLQATFRTGATSAADMRLQMDNVKTSLATVTGEMRNANSNGLKLTSMFELAAKKVAIWAGATTLIYGTLKQISEGTQYIKDLNKELTNIQIVTGMTSGDVNALAKEFNNLASELGSTTLEISRGSLEFMRQGKTAEETAILIRNATMMSKLGNLTAAESSEYLTSVMNGFKMEVRDTVGAVDAMIAVDNAAATSTKELAEALQRTSSTAQMAGVGFNDLISYIGTVSSVTRKSADSIGESFKTIFTRMQQVKLGNLDEEGKSISDVEKALKRVNIEIRDTPTSFRNMSDVLAEVAGRWSEFDEITRSSIAQALAGTRQYENLVVLLGNWSTAERLKSEAVNSSGLTQKRYNTYLEGTEAATNRLTAAWERLVTNTTNSGFVKWVIDAGTSLLKLVDAVGLFNLAIVVLSGIITFKLKIIIPELTMFMYQLVTAMGAATASATGLSLALSGGLIGVGIVVAIAAIAAAFKLLNNNIEETYNNFKKLKTQSDENKQELSSLAIEYEKLANKQVKTNEDIERLIEIQGILNNKYDALKDGVNAYTDAVNLNTQAIKNNIQWMKEQEAQQGLKFLEENKFKYQDSKKYLEERITLVNQWGKYNTKEEKQAIVFQKTREELLKIYAKRAEETSGAERQMWVDSYNKLVKEIALRKEIVQLYEHYLSFTNKPALTPESIDDDSIDRMDKLRNGINGVGEAASYTTEELEKMFSALESAQSQVASIIKSYQDLGQVGLKEITALKDLFGEDYIKALYREGNQIKLNTVALKELLIAEAYEAVVKANAAAIAGGYTDELVEQLNIMLAIHDQIANSPLTTEVENQQEAYQELLKITINMIKQQKNAEKEALREQLENYKEMVDSKIDALEKMAKKEKQRLQDQLDGYKAIIEAEINLINKKRDAEKHADEVSEKNKEIADIDAQLLALQFDNSEAANAKRLELEAERAEKTKELTNIQTEYSVEQQTNALEEELEAFEKENKAKQEIIERNLENQKEALEAEYKAFQKTIEAKIEAIENYLSQAGTINAEAMALLSNRTAGFYESLLEWNRIYGESVDQYIIDKWLSAFGLINSLSLAGLPSESSTTSGGGGGGSIQYMYHDGGIVGDKPKIKETEVYAKLLKGEVVANESQISQFINKTLPQLMSRGGETGVNMPVTIKVMGNLDKAVLPDLKNAMLEVVNTALRNRGIKRDSFSYSL